MSRSLNRELTRASAKLERQVDVCSANGTGVRGTGRAQGVAGASKSKGLKRQPIPTSVSISLVIIVSFLPALTSKFCCS
jgi:hypothetical protein